MQKHYLDQYLYVFHTYFHVHCAWWAQGHWARRRNTEAARWWPLVAGQRRPTHPNHWRLLTGLAHLQRTWSSTMKVMLIYSWNEIFPKGSSNAHVCKSLSINRLCIFHQHICSDYKKTTGLIFMKLGRRMKLGPKKNPLNFGADRNDRADTVYTNICNDVNDLGRGLHYPSVLFI